MVHALEWNPSCGQGRRPHCRRLKSYLDFTVESSSILRSNDPGSGLLDATLLIEFGVPVPATGLFFLHHKIIPPAGDPDSTGFSMTLTPIPVPEPATVLLLGAGMTGLLRRRRLP